MTGTGQIKLSEIKVHIVFAITFLNVGAQTSADYNEGR